jgi:hypothetical protein
LKTASKRTAAKSKKEYEREWLEALAIVRSEQAAGNENVIDIFDKYHKHGIRSIFESKYFQDVHKRVGLRVTAKQLPAERLVVLNGTYTTVPTDASLNYHLVDLLAQFVSEQEDQIDCIVELGSGIGRNLIALAYRLDPEQRKRILFYACEFTDSGKEVCLALGEMCDNLHILVEHFDYYEPDFSFLPQKSNVLIFTCHSIEQIPALDRRVLEEMIAATDRCFCYHAEPVGWQYFEDFRRRRELIQLNSLRKDKTFIKRWLYKIDRFVFSTLGVGFLDTSGRFGIDIKKADIGKSEKVSANAAKWSLAKDYNTNLVLLLKDIEREGLIRVSTEVVNAFGENPFNPTTIIAWHKNLTNG